MPIRSTRRAAVAAALLAAASASAAQVPVGTVLHYVKTNTDGSRPEQIALYVSAPDAIEVYKYHPGEVPAGLVTARFDWERTSLVELRSIQRASATEAREVARFDYDPVMRTGTLRLMGQESHVEFTHSPFGVYAFELADLNMLLARTGVAAAPVDVMLVDLAYSDPEPKLYERGRVSLVHVGEETRGGTAVQRFRMEGPGLGGQTATLWLNRDHGWIQEIESPVSNHPDWSSYRLRLERAGTMTPAEWSAFQTASIRSGGGG